MVHAEGGLHQLFAVAGDGAAHNLNIRVGVIEVQKVCTDDAHGVAAVRLVGRVKEVSRLVAEHSLDGCGAGVDAEVHGTVWLGKRFDTFGIFLMARGERLVVRFRGKQRRLVTVGAGFGAQSEPFADNCGRDDLPDVCQGAAVCDKIQRVFRAKPRGVQNLVEASAQLWKERQGTSEIEKLSRDFSPLRKPGDGLVDHRAQNACRDILTPCALIEKRLNVGFGKHAAARGNGRDGLGFGGKIVEFQRRDLHERRHLVDECAGAAGAGAVHAHFKAAGKKEDFCILAAEFDDDIRSRTEALRRDFFGEDLLYKRKVQAFRQAETC